VTTEHDYLYILDFGKTTANGTKLNVVFSDGTEATIVAVTTDSAFTENVLCSYTYNAMDNLYTLTQVKMPAQTNDIIDFDGDNILWLTNGANAELDDEVIAILNIEVNTSANEGEFALITKSLQFVPLKDLRVEMIEDDVDNKTYTQYTDYRLDAEKLFYVASFHIMYTTGADQDRLADHLPDLFDAVLSGEPVFRV